MILKIRDFKGELLYSHIILEFCEIFDIELFSENFFYDVNNKKIENCRRIKPAFFDYFSPLKTEMRKYQQEKYSWKSILKIAAYFNLHIAEVLEYMNSIKAGMAIGDYKNCDDNGRFIETSEVKAISSFKIQKDIQNIKRMDLLKSSLFQ